MWSRSYRAVCNKMGLETSSGYLRLTLALTAGIGCGIVIGTLLAARKRRSAASHSEQREAQLLDFGHVTGDYKMVFVVRNDLKMGKGKVAAQCGHAAIGAYKQMLRRDQELLRRWESGGGMKVVVKAPDEQSFLSAAAEAAGRGLSTHIVRDAGRTQIAAGSKTVLCIGPGAGEQVDTVTGHLKLY